MSDPTSGAVLTPRATATLAITDDERPVALDPSYVPDLDANSFIRALALQADGKVILGGDIHFKGDSTNRPIVRLNTDGSLDLSFDPGPLRR